MMLLLPQGQSDVPFEKLIEEQEKEMYDAHREGHRKYKEEQLVEERQKKEGKKRKQ